MLSWQQAGPSPGGARHQLSPSTAVLLAPLAMIEELCHSLGLSNIGALLAPRCGLRRLPWLVAASSAPAEVVAPACASSAKRSFRRIQGAVVDPPLPRHRTRGGEARGGEARLQHLPLALSCETSGPGKSSSHWIALCLRVDMLGMWLRTSSGQCPL